MKKRTRASSTLALLLGGLAVLTLTASPQTNDQKLVISALGVNMSNIGTGTTANVDFTIERWSSEQERKELIDTMLERGPEALLERLRDMPSHGFMRVGTGLGWDLRYAWQEQLPDGGRHIVLLTDRPISFWEARRQARTMDYPFTLIDLRINEDGAGEGKLSVATKIEFDKETNTIVLENYASEPVRLQNVRIRQ